MTEERLAEIKERLSNSATGDWVYNADKNRIACGIYLIAENTDYEEDALLIANAPKDISELVAEVERLQAELDKAVEFANYKLHYSNQLANELTGAYRAIDRLGGALEAITAHRVNHFITKDAMVASMFETAKGALRNE